ncbi:unnamed protein product [Cylindrotheca closterium]|uniref:Uncharacterized protein n=1 Tax=Cylindrotheca closterium TaxID=2856 RepID=A0AAD2CGD2_9STRA|nr:unnamed protein product [Cylindrotheca closterium]
MLIYRSLPGQPLCHAWHPQAVSYSHQLAPLQHPERYPTQLQLDAGQHKDINIDDVLLEAENALQVAEASLSLPKTNGSTLLTRSADAVAGLIGGMIFGALLGSLLFLQFPGLDLLISSPLILASFAFGTVGFASGFANTQTAAVIRIFLGSPIKGLLSLLGLVALKQVESGVQKVQSIPSKMVNSVAKKVHEIIQYPSKLAAETKNMISGTKDEQSWNHLNLRSAMLVITLPIIVWILTSQPF